MKTFLIGVGILSFSLFGGSPLVHAAQTSGATAVQGVPAPTAYHVVKEDGNSRTWQKEVYERTRDGHIVPQIHSYKELRAGVNFWDGNKWQPSREEIDVQPDGSAAALAGAHQVRFPADIYQGLIQMATPDGMVLRSQPAALAYDDGKNTVIIAVLTNSVGQLVGKNQVIYKNAFSGITADLLYTYKLSGAEQDVVIRADLPDPASLGLSGNVKLQMLTEFIGPAQPEMLTKEDPAEGNEPDTTLKFGGTTFGHGKAFLLGDETVKKGKAKGGEVKVYKTWLNLEGRTFLVESVPYHRIANELQKLPESGRVATPNGSKLYALRASSGHYDLPPRMATMSGGGKARFSVVGPQMAPLVPRIKAMIADTEPRTLPALVLDYVTVNAAMTNAVFQGDSTYYVGGEYSLYGTTTIEGGTVIKMDGSGQLDIDSAGSINCETGPYRMGVFTSINDDSVGEPLDISSGSPAFGDVWNFLNINLSYTAIHDMRFSYCVGAMNAGDMIDIWDCQFVNVDCALLGNNVGLHNVLVSRNSSSALDSPLWLNGTSAVAENVTFDDGNSDSGNFITEEGGGIPTITLAMTNCLVTGESVPNSGVVLLTNSTVFIPSNSIPIYQTVGAGGYYLTNNSPYRGMGTTNVSPQLLANLATKTTYPPIVYSSVTISTDTTFSQQAQRDNGATLDLGYHYDLLDYVFGGVTDATTNMVFTAGTAVGWFDSSGLGIGINPGLNILFNGTATQPCIFALYSTVQEENVPSWTGYSWRWFGVGSGGSETDPAYSALISPNFTHFYSLAGTHDFFRDDGSVFRILAQNCEFYTAGEGGYGIGLCMTNCLFDRMYMAAQAECCAQIAWRNCTMRGGNLLITHWGDWPAAITNCAFDGVNFSVDSRDLACGYNAYITNGATLPITHATDVYVTNFNWQASWLGNYYLPGNSALIDHGNTNANLLGLYHFTTQTNQVKEANSMVDIGYHYVATDANGIPISTPGDGVADYLADANGNGLVDIGEVPWTLGIISQPQSTNVVQGQNATFSVLAGGIAPFTYQWLSNSVAMPGVNGSSYTKLVVQVSDEANYSVVVGNATASVTSSVAVLKVTVPPVLTSSPADQTVIQGTNVHFTVSVSGNYLSYRWYAGSTPLTDGSRISGSTSSTLTVSNIIGADAAYYTVVVTNLFGGVSAAASLTVITNPGIVSPPTNTIVVQSEDVTFAVVASGQGLNYQWWATNGFQTNSIAGATSSRYTKLVVQTNDAGWYSVAVTNLAGSTNVTAKLDVVVPPWISQQPTNVIVAQGGNATFGITASGTTNLIYQWLKNGTNLIAWATNASMTLTNVQSSDAAGYSVLVTNIAGTNLSATAWLSINLAGGGTTNGWGGGGSPPSTLPFVSMISPTNASPTNPAVYQWGPPISIRANASSQYNYITNVAFYFTGTNNGSGFTLAGAAVPGANGKFALAWTNALRGTNIVKARAWDNSGNTSDSQLAYVIMAVPPTIYAGPAQSVVWTEGASGTNLSMSGSVSDDGYPFSLTTNVQWSVISGNGAYVSFANPNSLTTSVTFTTNGTFRLQLQVDNNYATNNQICTVTIKRHPLLYFNPPTNGATFLAGTPVVLNATAYPWDGSITNVSFYDGTNLTTIGTGIQSVNHTYTYAWYNAPLWTNVVSVVAKDDDGLTSTSTLSMTVVPPLAVWFSAPTNGQLFILSPTNILLSAQPVSYIGATVTSLVFSNQFGFLGAGTLATNSTYQFLWQDVTNGSYSLAVSATDNAGNRATNQLAITVNAMPTVSIVTPTNVQAFLEVTNVTLTARASDLEDGTNVAVAFYYTNTLIGWATNVPGTNLFSLVWTNRHANYYPVVAMATDTRGASTASGIGVFKVTPTNLPPTVAITYPTNGAEFGPGSDITITATATNGSGTVTNVEFFVNGVSIGNDPTAPYSITRCCWDPGNYTIVAKVTDDRGRSGMSTNIQINILANLPGPAGGFWDHDYAKATSVLNDPYWIWPYTIGVGAEGNIYLSNEEPGSRMYCITTNLEVIPFTEDGDWGPVGRDGTNLYSGVSQTETDDFVIKFSGTNWDFVGNGMGYGGEPTDPFQPIMKANAFAFVGGDVYMGGNYTVGTNVQYIAKLDTVSNVWVPVAAPLNGPVYALAVLQGKLIVGGSFTAAGSGSNANYIAELDGTNWTALGSGVAMGADMASFIATNGGGTQGAVTALAICGSNLFVGGCFSIAGGDPNANGVAIWNGQTWRTLNGGVGPSPGESFFAYNLQIPIVNALAVHGDRVYIGGQFQYVLQGATSIPARNIASATWSEDQQEWVWSDLDQGVWNSDPTANQFAAVDYLAIRNGGQVGQYDLVVNGDFDTVGHKGLPDGQFGLWRVGYPQSPSAPSVAITSPLSTTTFTNPTSILLRGLAVSGYTNIQSADFYTNNVEIGTYAGSTDSGVTNIFNFTNEWDYPSPGVYLINADAVDVDGLAGESAPIVISIKSATNLITAINDSYTIPENGPTAMFYVLTNDIPASGLKISQITQPYHNLGTVNIGHGGGYLTYTPFPNVYGTDIFFYTIADGTNVDSASVTVNVMAPPMVRITTPNDQQRVPAPASPLNIIGTAIAYGSKNSVTNVTLSAISANGTVITNEVPSSTAFSFNWTNAALGWYTFIVQAADTNGIIGASTPVTIALINTNAPAHTITASISNLQPTQSTQGGFYVQKDAVITQGIFDLQGQASDSMVTNPVAYKVMLYQPSPGMADITDDPKLQAAIYASAPPFADVTPGPLNAQGYHIGGDSSGDLGSLDLSGVANGVYELILQVRGGTEVTNTMVEVQLCSNLKIGQFGFSEQDMVIPVNGMPISVVRTYNSMNPLSGDFGYGWTFAMNSMDVSLDETRTDMTIGSDTVPFATDEGSDNGLPKVVSVRTGGSWDVTLTLPDGRRVTYPFDPRSSGSGNTYAQWDNPPGVTATLTPLVYGSDLIYPFPFPHWADSDLTFGNAPIQEQDFPGWILQTDDGTKYCITRGTANDVIYEDPAYYGPYFSATAYGPPKLTKIIQRNGDTIRIGDNSISHWAGDTNMTANVTFERDFLGRITAIRDPNTGTNGPATVKYVYNRDTGNLIYVEHLVNATAQTYQTNAYYYNNPNFPHYITSIVNASGVPVVRNLYDDAGRLIGMIDAAGNTNSLVHDTAHRSEVHYDPSGQPTYYTYDPQGNVIETTDALGHTNAFAYDVNGYLTNSVDALGNATSYVNDQNGNVLSVTLPHPAGADPAAYTTSSTYDQYGNQTSVMLPTGGMITNEYDTNGNLTATYDENNNLISFTTYNNGPGLPDSDGDQFGVNHYGYDGAGNLASFTNSLGGVTTSGYDANGNLTTLTDSSGTSSVGYDAMNREATADYGHGITISNGYSTYADWNTVDAPTIGHMERKFDDQGRLGGWVTPNGATPGFAYDVDGRLQYETNSIGVVTYSVYNAVGWLVAKTNETTGAGVTYGYDAAGHKTSETNTYGQVSSYAYWPSGSLLALTNAVGAYWHYSDAAGACSACGSSGIVTDYMGRVTESVTSAHDLPLASIRRAYPGATGSDAATNSTTYLAGLTTPEQEAADYPATVTDEGGHTRQYGYTTLGQVYKATDLSGSVWWTNQYDGGNGALTNVVSPLGETLGYTYDALDNVSTIRFADGNWLTNFYDGANRLNGERLPSGITVTNFYDYAGRLTNHSTSLGESAGFAYNGNDAITTMTDNTGTTTNQYDAAGRLWGVDYPGGAGVRYQLDLLDRITVITNWASSGGTAYVTHYQYDALGNITNVIDPFNGQTSFTYDQAGRRSTRTLPNGIVTTWQYNWKDQVTNIVHKVGSTVLASVGYVRGAGGEPTQITREDGTYVQLAYDAAWRLTNEVYYSAGNVPQTTNSYGYDADGDRIMLIKNGTILTNGVSPGYEITAVKNGGTTVESYAYDTGGREMTITRNGATLNLGYNSADQVTAVTNGSAWVRYVHDAAGRRTISTNSAGVVRHLLVAMAPGSDLASPQLIANGSGTVQQGYVYVGDEPVLRYTGSGTASYYLEDGMGSIIGLAPASSPGTGNTTRLFYDGFGNATATNGPAPANPSGTEGDFRFHGAWLEADSGLYNMRAREYDARTGRFTSRDPMDGDLKSPEEIHPYNYANENPFIFSDPSGGFSIIEINFSMNLQSGLQAVRADAVQQARNQLLGRLRDGIQDVVFKQLQSFLPIDFSKFRNFGTDLGDKFEEVAQGFICDSFRDAGVADQFHFKVHVASGGKYSGDPLTPGFHCSPKEGGGDAANAELSADYEKRKPHVKTKGIPDFIISPQPPLGPNGEMSWAWLVGDFKASTRTFYNAYVPPGKKQAQFVAIADYARYHTIDRTAVFIVGFNNLGEHKRGKQSPEWKQIRRILGRQLTYRGVIACLINILN